MPALLNLSVLDNRPAASCKGTAAATYLADVSYDRRIPEARFCMDECTICMQTDVPR